MILSQVSIGKKITGTMIIFLSIMLIMNIISYVKMQLIDAELQKQTKYVIPLSANIENIGTYILKEQYILEKLIREYNLKDNNLKNLTKELNRFKTLNKKVNSQINNTNTLLKTSLKEIDSKENVIEVAKLVPILKIISREHQDLNTLIMTILNTKEENKAGSFNRHIEKLEQEIFEMDTALDLAVVVLENLMKNESEHILNDFKVHEYSIIISIFIFLVGVIIAPKISTGIVAPLKQVTSAAQEISEGNLHIEIPINSNDEIGILSKSFNQMAKELIRKEQIKETFGKYIDPRIVEGILRDDNTLKVTDGSKKNMTIFFSDIEKFTSISEQLTPNGLIILMNRYFSLVSEPISKYKGVIDKYIGDAVMAFWGDPFTLNENHAVLCCKAALEQFKKIDELNDGMGELLGFRKGLPDVKIRIGICTGDVIAGSIGSIKSQSYTVIGDTVNIASRLESVNKLYGTRILISESTYLMLEGQFVTRLIDKVTVVGLLTPLKIYELISEVGKIEDQAMQWIQTYEKAIDIYTNKNWDESLILFEKCIEINPSDYASKVLIKRINMFKETPPVSDWDGTWNLLSK